jgi:hypothetical protein
MCPVMIEVLFLFSSVLDFYNTIDREIREKK